MGMTHQRGPDYQALKVLDLNGVPVDQFAQKLGEGKYREWVAYFVKDPVTGKMMFNNNPGDYDGYNERFGGLKAFREAIHGYRQRGTAETTKLVRQAMDEAKPGSVLTTEHPGYDFLMQFIDGCITYDVSVQATSLRPLECNLQRFYFPECKAYELVYGGLSFDPGHHRRFWNAVASFGSFYPPPMDAVLREHREVFAGRDCRALVPTLARAVYANRFSAGEKTIWTLYNATGHTYAGPVLKIELKPGEHVFDLLRGREADVAREGGAAVVRCFLPRDESACLIRRPHRPRVGGNGFGDYARGDQSNKVPTDPVSVETGLMTTVAAVVAKPIPTGTGPVGKSENRP